MRLAPTLAAAGGDSGGYANLCFVAGDDVAAAGFWIRSEGEDRCGRAAATALPLLLQLLLLRLGVGEEGARSSIRSVPVRSSSAFRVGAVGCGKWRGTSVRGKERACVRSSAR